MTQKKSGKRPVERTFIDASTGKKLSQQTVVTDANDVATEVNVRRSAPVGDPGPRRAIAIALWIVAIIFEVLALLVFNGTLSNLPGNPLVWLIAFIVIDLICVIIAGLLWKKANHMDPPSEANKVEFFLKSQLGAILSVLAFLPLIVLILMDKDANPQLKKVGAIAAAAALVIGLGSSIDYHPVSAEDLAETEQAAIALGDGNVYWTPFGHVYHLNPNCQAIINSTEISVGTASEAYAAGRTRACKFCAEASGSDVLKELSQTDNVAAGTADDGHDHETSSSEALDKAA